MTSPAPAPATTGAATTPTDGAVSGASGTVVTAQTGSVVTSQVSIGVVEPDAIQALQVGLGTAHAAIWTYGLISAYDPDDSAVIRANRLAYVTLRDTTTDLLRTAGADPIRTEAAYAVPVVVVDRATAQQLAVAIEKDVTNAWRAVIGLTDNVELRKYALLALSAAAVRLTQWRQLAAVNPFTVPFPGDEA